MTNQRSPLFWKALAACVAGAYKSYFFQENLEISCFRAKKIDISQSSRVNLEILVKISIGANLS